MNDQITSQIKASADAAGVPEKVTDAEALARVARLVAARLRVVRR